MVFFLAPFGHVDQIVPLLTQNPDLTRVRTMFLNKQGTRYRVVEWSRPPGQTEVQVRSYAPNQFRAMMDGQG